MRRSIGICLAALLCASHAATAQPPADPTPAEQEPQLQTRTLDVGDVLHVVLHRDTELGATDAGKRLYRGDAVTELRTALAQA
jgi:hypothetical protein